MDQTASVSAVGDGLEATVLLPSGVASSAGDVTVEIVGDDTLFLESVTGWKLHVPLPFPVDPDTGRVRFRRATGKLTFTATARAPSQLTTPSCAQSDGDNTDDTASALVPVPAGSAGPSEAVPGRGEESSGDKPQESGCPRRESGSGAQTGGGGGPCSPCSSGAGAGAGTSDDAALYAEFFCDSPPSMAAAAACANGKVAAAGGGPAAPAAGPAATTVATASPGVPGASGGGGADAAPAAEPGSSSAAVPARAPAPTSTGVGPDRPSPPDVANPAEVAVLAHPEAALSSSAADAPASAVGPRRAAPHTPAAEPAAAAAAAAAATTRATAPAAAPAAPAAPPAGGNTKAARVSAAFESTGGTASRAAGFSFTAPDLPPPPPLPAGLPPVAPPIDCRYLAVANGLRVSGHTATAALAEAMGLMGARRQPSARAERRKNEKVDAILQNVADTLDAYGYAVLDNYIAEAAVQGARRELRVMEPHYSPGMIWVGKEAETGAQIAVSSVRGDVVLWLDDPALNATAFIKDGVRRDCSFMQLQQMLADVDELVFEGLRPRLPYLAGLHRRSDAMMAVYPGKGARFAKHVDNTTGDGRRLTVLTYLNPGWQEQQGGALRLFPVREGAAPQVDVLPVAGRVALFLSAEVAHEVMPAFAPRHAVTLWYFDAGEHAAALTAAKMLPGASSRPSAQAAATALLRDLLADEAASGVQATPEGCAALGTRVAALEPGAQQLLAAVLGLPSAAALVESMRNLTPDSLRRRREELRTMGLETQHHAPDTSGHGH